MAVVVADSSSFIHLAAIGRVGLLRELYGYLIVPLAVWQEVVVAGRGRPGETELRGLWRMVGFPWKRHPPAQSFRSARPLFILGKGKQFAWPARSKIACSCSTKGPDAVWQQDSASKWSELSVFWCWRNDAD